MDTSEPPSKPKLAHAMLGGVLEEFDKIYSSLPFPNANPYSDTRLCWSEDLVTKITPKIREAITILEDLLTIIPQEATSYDAQTLRNKNLLRPAVSLPNELLSLIFTYACFHDLSVSYEISEPLYEERPRPYVYFRDGRNTVISVCSRWRQVALETRVLWGTMFVTSAWEGTEQFPLFANIPEILSVEMPRASAHPVSLYAHTANPGEWATLYSIIEPVMPTCQLLSVRISSVAGTWSTSIAGVTLPSLRALVLELTADNGHNTPLSIPLPNTPNLEDLEVRFRVLGGSRNDIQTTILPLPHLRNLSLCGHFPVLNVFDMLHHAPKLEGLWWVSTQELVPFSAPNPPSVSLTHLRHLYIEGRAAFQSASVIQAPALEQFTIGLTESDRNPFTEGTLHDVVACLEAVSFTQITTLALSMNAIHHPCDLALSSITRFASLRRLVIKSEVTHETCLFLNRVPSTHPDLRDVWIESYDTPKEVAMEGLKPLLSSRAAFFDIGVVPFPRLNLHLCLLALSSDDMRELAEMGGPATPVRAAGYEAGAISCEMFRSKYDPISI